MLYDAKKVTIDNNNKLSSSLVEGKWNQPVREAKNKNGLALKNETGGAV